MAAFIRKDLEAAKPQLVAKFDDMLGKLLDNLSAQYPQIRAELDSAAAAYRTQALLNVDRGQLVDLSSIPELEPLVSKAQSLGIVQALEDAMMTFNDQLVSEFKKVLKGIFELHAEVVDSELEEASNTFIREYPEMAAKIRAALTAAKAHFRAEVANL